MPLWYINQNGFVCLFVFEREAVVLAQITLLMGPVGALTWWYFSLVPECIVEIATVGN